MSDDSATAVEETKKKRGRAAKAAPAVAKKAEKRKVVANSKPKSDGEEDAPSGAKRGRGRPKGAKGKKVKVRTQTLLLRYQNFLLSIQNFKIFCRALKSQPEVPAEDVVAPRRPTRSPRALVRKTTNRRKKKEKIEPNNQMNIFSFKIKHRK